MIQKIWAWLDGKKSYIASIVIGVVAGGMYLGVLDQKTAEIILTAAGAILGVSLRLAISKTAAPNG